MRIIVISLCLFLASCTWFTKKEDPLPTPKEVVHLNLPDPKPLDLSKYKELNLAITQYENKTEVCIDYRDVALLMELLAILEGRIEEQHEILQQYRKYYESE